MTPLDKERGLWFQIMDSSALKTLFLQRVSLGGNELEVMSQAFSDFYPSFQTDVVGVFIVLILKARFIRGLI